MLRSNSKQSGGIHVVKPEERKGKAGEKYLQKRKVLSLEWKSDIAAKEGLYGVDEFNSFITP